MVARRDIGATIGLYLTVAAASFAVCILAVALNLLFYASHGPFYDSMAYLDHLAVLMTTARSDGVLRAFCESRDGSTVMLPWLEGIPLGLMVQPSRPLGVWIQAPWVLSLALAGVLYFRRYSQYPFFVAGAFAVALIGFNGVFYFNGGLSDFRMDLLQALTFGAATALYLTARASDRLWIWIGFGILLSVTCLARATTPVYAILVFGGFAVVDLVFGPRRLYLMLRYILAAAIVAALCGWFYVLNFQQLYYYYFVWNTDAIAHLPLKVSIQHAYFVIYQHIGMPLMLSAIIVLACLCVGRLVAGSVRASDLNWRAFWAAVAPVGYLIVSGAGLNPFVSLVSVPGVLLFMLAPLRSQRPVDPRLAMPLGVLILAAALATAAVGVRNYMQNVSGWIPTRTGLDQLVDRLTERAPGEKGAFSFQSMYVGAVDTPTISNVLTFDRGFLLNQMQCSTKGDVALYPVVGGYAQPLEWNNLPGNTTAEKIDGIVDAAMAKSDFLIVPEPSSELAAHVPINPHAFEIRRMLLERHGVESLGGPIKLANNETVQVYRNTTRSQVARPAGCHEKLN